MPARVVTGYLGGEWNPIGGYCRVRQSHAHAWAEVWLDGPRLDARGSHCGGGAGTPRARPAIDLLPGAGAAGARLLRRAAWVAMPAAGLGRARILVAGGRRRLQLQALSWTCSSRLGLGERDWRVLAGLLAAGGIAWAMLVAWSSCRRPRRAGPGCAGARVARAGGRLARSACRAARTKARWPTPSASPRRSRRWPRPCAGWRATMPTLRYGADPPPPPSMPPPRRAALPAARSVQRADAALAHRRAGAAGAGVDRARAAGPSPLAPAARAAQARRRRRARCSPRIARSTGGFLRQCGSRPRAARSSCWSRCTSSAATDSRSATRCGTWSPSRRACWSAASAAPSAPILAACWCIPTASSSRSRPCRWRRRRHRGRATCLSGQTHGHHADRASWADVQAGLRDGDGYNVVLHEFAHFLDHALDGTLSRACAPAQTWHGLLRARIRRAVRRGGCRASRR